MIPHAPGDKRTQCWTRNIFPVSVRNINASHRYALTTNPFPAAHPPPYEPVPLISLLQKSANLTPSRADAGGSNAVGSGHPSLDTLRPSADVHRNYQPTCKLKAAVGVAPSVYGRPVSLSGKASGTFTSNTALLRRLERRGVDVADEVQLLAQLEEMQLQYVDHYDRVGDQILGMVKPENE